MGLSKLESLYMTLVAEHAKHPHHYGELADSSPVVLNNPTCGDVLSLSLLVKGDKIENIAFKGDGCSISMASASMMTDAVLGKTQQEALALAEVFSEMVQGKENQAQKELGDAALLIGVSKFPQRIKCATLAWNALKKALEESTTV